MVFSDKFNLTDRSHFFTQWVKKAAAQIINLIGSAASFYFFIDYLGYTKQMRTKYECCEESVMVRAFLNLIKFLCSNSNILFCIINR